MNRFVVVAHRLSSSIGRIENRQATMGEKNSITLKNTFGIGTTMSHRFSHLFTQPRVRATVKRTFACDPTHYQ
jgi:hypothetical protein